jgi:DNA polymerase-3 subunit epsilon
VVTAQELKDLESVAVLLGLGQGGASAALKLDQANSNRRVASAERIGVSSGDRVVFTGEMSRPRADMEARAVDVGLVPTTGISRKTSLLVIADPHS